MASPTPFALFSYGTLRQPEVQRATWGRPIEGRPDALAGYRLAPLAISSAEVVRLSGKAVHSIARRTGRPEDRIEGMVFALSADQLEATDSYEVDAYARRAVRLESGLLAFAYVGPDD